MYDIFISYCSQNQKQADRIHKALTDSGYVCWYAPSDLYGTEDFVRVIPPAIRDSKAFLLLLSSESQESKWVYRELRMADEQDKPIFTFFLHKFALNDTFSFLLQSNHHYLPTMSMDEQISHLLTDLPKVLGEPPVPPVPPRKKAPLGLILGGIGGVLAILAALFFLFFRGPQDGSYVIWNPAYSTSLACDPINHYYHAGETVLCKGDTLTSFSQKSVWELDFLTDETFTMSHNGQPLGVQPGYNGIGLGGEYTAIEWELIDAGDDYYYIRNTETGFYLEWYAQKDNWATHDAITEDNRDLFLLRLDNAS